jgi:hypothetical protein
MIETGNIEKLIRDKLPSQIQSAIKENYFFRFYRAQQIATSKNRLDLCAAEIANYLFHCKLSGQYPIRDRVCLEIGSGWVLSHSLILYLLGAKKVYSTDVVRLLSPSAISKSIQSSVRYIINDCLAGFEQHELIKTRLYKLYSINKFTLETLKEIGIEYIAPIDLVREPLEYEIDFIYSKAVLEHIPNNEIVQLLNNLVNSLSKNGMMFHLIHLEDHLDITNKPFEFLAEPKEYFTKAMQNQRGNRIRKSEWEKIFSSIDNLDYRFVFEWSRQDRDLPSKIDSSIDYLDEADLRVSHLGVFGSKR